MLHLIIDAVCVLVGFGVGRISKSKLAALESELKSLEVSADSDLKAAVAKVKSALRIS